MAPFIIQNYAYAGHGEDDAYGHMADCTTLQTSLDQRRDSMAKRLRTVFALEKLYVYPFDLGRHEHNGKSRMLHEILIHTLIKAIGPLVPATIDPMLTPDQTAALNRIRVQDTPPQHKTYLLNLHQSGRQDEVHRAIAAVTNPNPLQRTTAPYELPAAMMEDAPEDAENTTHFCGSSATGRAPSPKRRTRARNTSSESGDSC